MKKYILIGIIIFLFPQLNYADNPVWGRLANPGFENEHIKSTLFFTGNWRNGIQFYDFNPSDNTGLFTIHPSDSRHLGWSENASNREFAVNTLIDAGVNVINMSYWGLPGTDNWAYWAPMQTSTGSHDELFDIALDKNILIAPYIESYAATDEYDGFSFMDDFPGSVSVPSPQLIVMIEDLVDRYLVNPDNILWPDKWAKVYDKDGVERYLISIIHVASNQGSVTDQSFAEGFDRVAEAIFANTGIHIGFALDILPSDSYAPGSFKATAVATGPYLVQQSSILAIQCFIPEIWTGLSNENDLINWKNSFHAGWINTGIPFIHDISSGYDAHIVFPSSPLYGNNQLWRNLQSQAINNFESTSLTINAWNGYTEGFAGVPTVQYGDTTYHWVCDLFGGTCGHSTALTENTNHEQKLKITPNPATDYFDLFLSEQDEQFICIQLVNNIGSLFNSQYITGDINYVRFPTITLSDGLYYLVVQTNKCIYVRKILLLR